MRKPANTILHVKNKLLTRKHVKQNDINQIFNCDLRKKENGLSV